MSNADLETPRDNPIDWFLALHAHAQEHEQFEADRCALATADADGTPSVRFVLVREVSDAGFVFYTNYESDKAHVLDDNGRGAVAYHWHTIGVQVRVRGPVRRASDAQSDAYFASRPRGSQIGAWASPQSQIISAREDLETRIAEVEARFGEGPVSRPPFWGGYVLEPERIEMWFARESRLHDRYRYLRADGAWTWERLAP